MIGNKFLLDTNIIVAWLKGEKQVAENIDNAEAIFIPIIVVGELFYGAAFSTHIRKNTTQVRKIIKRYKVLGLDENTAIAYGRIKAALRRKGRPIPENDIWIGAIATQYSLIVVTRDKHFEEIDGLPQEKW